MGVDGLVRLNVQLVARQPADWPHFAGSTLRGAFGRALRETACVTGKPDCKGCPLRQNCSYAVIFDPLPPTQPLHPSFRNGLPRYVIQAPRLGACQLSTGMVQDFSLLMLPGTHPHLSLVQRILPSFVERHLILPGLFKLGRVTTGVIDVENEVDTKTASPQRERAVLLRLRWRTPFRLQENGKPFTDARRLDARLLVRAFLRRKTQWCQLTDNPAPDYAQALHAAAHCQIDARNLHWHDMHRRTSIRNEKIPLGGLFGTATLHGPEWAMRELMPLIRLSENIHVGKETIMGLGQFEAGRLEPA
jgi:hypothetical protein